METPLLQHIDSLIEKYRKNHKGEAPLYIVLSPDERKEVTEALKVRQNASEDTIITTYKDIKLTENPGLLKGNIYVGNELPETGS